MRVLLSILIICFFSFITSAQLCQGSLGDPVVNINFGAGTGVGTALSSSLTNYTFTSALCPNDGSYTIVDTTGFCFNATWHRLTEDHTPGDVNGRMMLVNASIEPGDFYVSTVNNLCGGTTYEFAAWIVNVLKTSSCGGNGNKPNVTFRIETTGGQLIQSYSTGDIAADFNPQWKQYGFFFQTPANVNSVVIRMRNNAPGGCGNDLALDDITFRPCGAKINVNVVGYTSNNITSCENKPNTYQLVGTLSSGLSSPAYQWQSSANGGNWADIAGQTTNTLTVNLTQAGTYQYRLSIGESSNIAQSSCRTNSEVVQIVIEATPLINLPVVTDLCLNDAVKITITGTGTYQWSGPNGFTSTQNPLVFDPVIKSIAGKYVLTVQSTGGCIAKDSTTIIVHDLPAVNAGPDILLCSGTSVMINATATGTVKWNPVAGLNNATIVKPTVNTNATTTYMLTATDGYGCSKSDDVLITVVKSPTADAGADKEIFEGDSVQLHATVGGDNISYSWSPALNISPLVSTDPLAYPKNDISYTLTVSSQAGCATAYDDVFVKVYKQVIIPNSFSPNGDGINDTWILDGLQTYPEVKWEVFNRYGVKVLEKTGYTPWNGTANNKVLQSGVYYYVIDTKKNKKFTGWLLLLR